MSVNSFFLGQANRVVVGPYTSEYGRYRALPLLNERLHQRNA
jgi:hypothetical protein